MTEQAKMREPDTPARRRVRVARQAFRVGERLADAAISDADRVSAVVQLDFAVETVLRAVAFDRQLSTAKADRFRELLNGVGQTLHGTSSFPGRAGIEQARSIRNAAQHEARIPTPTELSEAVVHSRDALLSIARVAWGIDFLVSDIDEIRSEAVRNHLHRASASRSEGDTAAAMGWLRRAFEYAFAHGGENLVGRPVEVAELLVRDRQDGDPPDPFGHGKDAAVALRRLQVLGRLTAFGIGVPQYLQWRGRLLEAPAININGELIRHENDRQWTDEEVDRAAAFVIDAALRMEHVVPDLDPGGFRSGGFDKL